MQRKVIGILGGCGPYAGINLVKCIFDQTIAKKDQDHIPVFLSSMPDIIADRTAFLDTGNGENPGHAIANSIGQMESIGVSIAGLACNTSYVPDIYDVILRDLAQMGCKIKLVHMIEETVAFIRNTYSFSDKIAVLGTNGLFQSGLYNKMLADAGFKIIKPALSFQREIIHKCIYDEKHGIKARSNPVTDWARQRIIEVIRHFKQKNVKIIVLGCTEFSLAISDLEVCGLKVVDSTKILARALIRDSYPYKLRPWT